MTRDPAPDGSVHAGWSGQGGVATLGPMSEDALALVEYDAMARQLAEAAAAVPAARRRGPPVAASYRKGTLELVLRSEALPRDRFFEILDVLGNYTRTWSEFRPTASGCTLVADAFSSLQRKPPRTGSASTPLPAPWKVAIAFDSDGTGTITFSKDSLLLQEELNCVLDLWWRVAVDEAPAEELSAVAYDAMVAQLGQACERDLGRVTVAARNGTPPLCTYRQGTVAIELGFQTLSRDSFFPVLDLVGKYVRGFGELKPGSFACTVVTTPPRRRGAPPSPLELRFGYDPRGSGKLTFSKGALLTQEELNCVLEVWRLLAIRHTVDGPARDPRAALAELGAVVFEPDPAFGPGRVVGYEATKRDIRETVVLPLARADVFVALARLTRGHDRASAARAVLFEGPPGTGKTTMARVIATEAGIPMVYVPVESIMSKWYGESERRLDAIFDLAGALGQTIVFLDEIDAFAGSRDRPMHEGTRRILSVLLRQMQGLVETTGVMVVGATNRADDLDAALTSRFARTIRFPLPDQREREAILGHYARTLTAGEVAEVAALADGLSGRNLEDGCGAAERLWAGQLIATGAPVTGPPVDAYLTAFRAIVERR